MKLTVRANLHYEATHPCEILLQIEAASLRSQRCTSSRLVLTPDPGSYLVEADNGIGTLRWVNETKVFMCQYDATFEVDRLQRPIAGLHSSKVSQTPAHAMQYLLPSRYCHPEAFFDFLSQEFSDLSGGALVDALCQWLKENFSYDIYASHAGTTATDSFALRAGVCRDYAHVLIAMARAGGIPARYASVYAPGVNPPDFHAVAEIFLEGEWHIIDPTGMAQPEEMICIGVGRDAADTSFLTSYGAITLKTQTVRVSRTAIADANP